LAQVVRAGLAQPGLRGACARGRPLAGAASRGPRRAGMAVCRHGGSGSEARPAAARLAPRARHGGWRRCGGAVRPEQAVRWAPSWAWTWWSCWSSPTSGCCSPSSWPRPTAEAAPGGRPVLLAWWWGSSAAAFAGCCPCLRRPAAMPPRGGGAPGAGFGTGAEVHLGGPRGPLGRQLPGLGRVPRRGLRGALPPGRRLGLLLGPGSARGAREGAWAMELGALLAGGRLVLALLPAHVREARLGSLDDRRRSPRDAGGGDGVRGAAAVDSGLGRLRECGGLAAPSRPGEAPECEEPQPVAHCCGA